MASVICLNRPNADCKRIVHWKAAKGARLAAKRCHSCGGEMRLAKGPDWIGYCPTCMRTDQREIRVSQLAPGAPDTLACETCRREVSV
jgi:hypothetical protein